MEMAYLLSLFCSRPKDSFHASTSVKRDSPPLPARIPWVAPGERELRALVRKLFGLGHFSCWLVLLAPLCISVWADSAGWTKLNMIRQKESPVEEEHLWHCCESRHFWGMWATLKRSRFLAVIRNSRGSVAVICRLKLFHWKSVWLWHWPLVIQVGD